MQRLMNAAVAAAFFLLSASIAVAQSVPANQSYMGPTTGSPAEPSFRSLVGADLPTFSSSEKGAVPASAGGTTNFLRADGAFAAPTPNFTPAAFTSTAIQTAVTAACSAGGGLVQLQDGNYAFASAASPVLIDCDNVWIVGSSNSNLLAPADSSVIAGLIRVQGASGTDTTFAANAAIGDLTITATSAAAISVGNYIKVEVQQASTGYAWIMVTRVVGKATNVLTLADPMPFVVSTGDTITSIRPLTMRENVRIINVRLYGNGNSGDGTRAILAQNMLRGHMDGIFVSGFHNAAGIYYDLGYANSYGALKAFDSGDADEDDILIRAQTAMAGGNIISEAASGFGPKFQYTAWSTFGDTTSRYANSRGTKLQGVVFSKFNTIEGSNSGSTGVGITLGSSDNVIDTIIAHSNRGAATGNLIGVWFSQQHNRRNQISTIIAKNNAEYDIRLFSTDDNNVVMSAFYDTLDDGGSGNRIPASGAGVTAGSGDVTAAASFGFDNRLIRSDGTGKGVQASGIAVDDSVNMTGVTSITVANDGLKTKDIDASHNLTISTDSNLTADRTVNINLGDATRALAITADSSIGGTAYVAGGTDVAVGDGGTGLSSGTSGGILGFTGATTIVSSGALTANNPVIGGGAGATPSSGSRSGNTTTFATTSGTLTSGNCAKFDASGNVVDHGSACGGGGSGITVGSSAITGGTANRLLYETSGNVVGEIANGTDGQMLIGQTSAAPSWQSSSGDVTINASGVTAIGANKVANAQLAQMAANTFKGNDTGSTANAKDLTVNEALVKLQYPFILAGYAEIDFNAANTDHAITIASPTTNYRLINAILINTGTTASLTTARGGLFSSTGGAGTTFVADAALSSLIANSVNTANNMMFPTIGITSYLNFSTLYWRTSTAQGASASGKLYLFIEPLP